MKHLFVLFAVLIAFPASAMTHSCRQSADPDKCERQLFEFAKYQVVIQNKHIVKALATRPEMVPEHMAIGDKIANDLVNCPDATCAVATMESARIKLYIFHQKLINKK